MRSPIRSAARSGSTDEVIVVGCGRVGVELATSVAACGHSVTVVDKARRAFRKLPAGSDGDTVVGLGFDRDPSSSERVSNRPMRWLR